MMSENISEDRDDAIIEPTRTIQSNHFDTTKWKAVKLRDDDIVIVTAYKAGTTWVQNIVKELLYFERPVPQSFLKCCPWLDFRFPRMEMQSVVLETCTERRLLKTHSPVEAIPFSKKVKYIYVGRDGRDCFMSLVNQYRAADETFYSVINDENGLVGPPMPRFIESDHNEAVLFDRWIGQGWPAMEGETDGWPFWSLFDNVASWWNVRTEKNVLFVHFNDLKRDLLHNLHSISNFIDVSLPDDAYEALATRLSFDHLKISAMTDSSTVIAPPGIFWRHGLNDFFYRGTNGRWMGILSEEQLIRYDEKASSKLCLECKVWLEHGSLPP